jgi:alpha-1,4-digalacturonate transport system substrate-binding protein
MIVLSTIVFSSIFTGCGGSNEGENSEVTLDFVWFSDGVEGDVMKSIVNDYTEENENIKVNFIEVAFDDLNTKLRTMIAGGEPPALARITETGSYVNTAIDLGEYYGGVDEFSSQFMDSLEPYYVIDDKAIAAPTDVTANGLIYNKTIFEKAGVEVPQSIDESWTWDEIFEISDELVEKGGAKYGMVVDFTPHRWSTFLYEFGGSLLNEDGTESVINNENGVNALETFIKLHEEKVVPESVWLGSENPNTLFRTGTIGMHLAGNWMLSNYKDIEDFEWGATYLPKGTMNSSVPGGKFLMGFKGTDVEDETADLINYLVSAEVNSNYCEESLFMSPRNDSTDLDYEFGKEMFELFSTELENTTPKAANDWSKTELISKVSTDYKNNIVDAVSGKISAQEALDNIAEITNEAIADLN